MSKQKKIPDDAAAAAAADGTRSWSSVQRWKTKNKNPWGKREVIVTKKKEVVPLLQNLAKEHVLKKIIFFCLKRLIFDSF